MYLQQTFLFHGFVGLFIYLFIYFNVPLEWSEMTTFCYGVQIENKCRAHRDVTFDCHIHDFKLLLKMSYEYKPQIYFWVLIIF